MNEDDRSQTENPVLLSRARVLSTGLETGKLSVADAWEALRSQIRTTPTQKPPAKPMPITDEERRALELLPSVYGVVQPETPRLLTSEEQADLVEERRVIDVILGLIKKRKDVGIREVIANHLDAVLKQEMSTGELAALGIDGSGHYQVKQEHPVPGTGQKLQKTVSNPKPVLTMAEVQRAHDEGLIDRKTFLKITRMPEVPRVLDERGLTSAIKADPSLMLTLAGLTTRADSVTTIKVVSDNQ